MAHGTNSQGLAILMLREESVACVIKCSSFKSMDLRSDSDTTDTKLGKVACLCDSSSVRAEAGVGAY